MIPRLRREFQRFDEEPTPNIRILTSLTQFGETKEIKAQIIGPAGSLYEYKIFDVVVTLENFPFKQPKIKFLTKICNPNIHDDQQQKLCKTIQDAIIRWHPTNTITSAISAVVDLLADPTLRSHRCHDWKALRDFNQNYPEFVRRTRQYCELYCQDARDTFD